MNSFALIAALLASAAPQVLELPAERVSLSPQQQQAIVDAVGVDGSQVRRLLGWRVEMDEGREPALQASVTVATAALGPGLEAARQIECLLTEGAWRCDLAEPIELFRAALPDECSEQGVRGPHGQSWILVQRSSGDLESKDLPALLDLLCHSDQILREAWQQGHTLHWIREEGGMVEVATLEPDTRGSRGLVFQLEATCTETGCSFRVARMGGWVA